jgi:hypothetical protein
MALSMTSKLVILFLQPTEEDLRTKSVCTILAEMMHKEATKAKKAEALKADVAKVKPPLKTFSQYGT